MHLWRQGGQRVLHGQEDCGAAGEWRGNGRKRWNGLLLKHNGSDGGCTSSCVPALILPWCLPCLQVAIAAKVNNDPEVGDLLKVSDRAGCAFRGNRDGTRGRQVRNTLEVCDCGTRCQTSSAPTPVLCALPNRWCSCPTTTCRRRRSSSPPPSSGAAGGCALIVVLLLPERVFQVLCTRSTCMRLPDPPAPSPRSLARVAASTSPPRARRPAAPAT